MALTHPYIKPTTERTLRRHFLSAVFLQIEKLAIAFSQKLRYFKDVEKLRGGRIDTRRESAAVWQRFSCISWGETPASIGGELLFCFSGGSQSLTEIKPPANRSRAQRKVLRTARLHRRSHVGDTQRLTESRSIGSKGTGSETGYRADRKRKEKT